MNIDKGEVLRSFRQNPKYSQVEVISELWDVQPIEIIKILTENGIVINFKKRRGRKRKDDISLVMKRLKVLEFRCLSCPEVQEIYFDEMQELREKVNKSVMREVY